MKNVFVRTLITLATTLTLVSAVEAHHSFSMFERVVQKVVTGTVARWAFNNPHSWLYLNVTNPDGTETLWSFEGGAPPQLVGRGVTGNTFKPGETLTLMYCPLVDGRAGGALGWIKKTDNTYVTPSDGGCRSDPDTNKRWEGWIEQGFRSNEEAPPAAGV